MSTAAPTTGAPTRDPGPRPDPGRTPGAGRRAVSALTAETVAAVLVVAAAVLAMFGAPAGLRTTVSVLAGAAVLGLAAPLRRRGGVDAGLVGVGGLVVVAVLLGLVLDAFPGGLSRTSYATGYAVVGLVGIGWAHRRRAGAPLPVPTGAAVAATLRRRWATALGVVVSLAVLAAALVVSTSALDRAERAPVALALTPAAAGGGEVATVSSGVGAGPFRLFLDDGAGGRDALGGQFRVGPDQPVTRRLPDAATGTSVVLTEAASGRTLRTVVVGAPAGSVQPSVAASP